MAKLFNDKTVEDEFQKFIASQRGEGPEEPELDAHGKPVLDKKTGKPKMMKSKSVGAFRPIKWIISFIIDVAVRRVKARADAQGEEFDEDAARKTATEAVEALGDGKILEWLRDGGFEALIAFFMQLISIFMKKKPVVLPT